MTAAWTISATRIATASRAAVSGIADRRTTSSRRSSDILAFTKRQKIRNTIWLTAAVHYTAAHYYDPNNAAFQDFDPFWEFVSGPIHAGSVGPNQLDGTFGPQLAYIKAPTKEQGQNLSPAFDLQFFGHVAIDGETERATVTLYDLYDWNNVALWSKILDPRQA